MSLVHHAPTPPTEPGGGEMTQFRRDLGGAAALVLLFLAAAALAASSLAALLGVVG